MLTVQQLISAGTVYGCSEEILSIAALLSVQSIYSSSPENKKQADTARKRWAVHEGDHLTMLNSIRNESTCVLTFLVYNSFIRHGKSAEWCAQRYFNYRALSRAVQIRNQITKYMKRCKIPLVSCGKDHVAIQKAIVSGFFAHAARLAPDGSYRTVRDNQVHLSNIFD